MQKGDCGSREIQQIEEEEEEEDIDEALSNPFVRKSLKTLKEVPSFYDHILELVATQRRSCVTRRFLLALTSGYNGMPPIEMKAHDPVNYVGDMLAFLFRSFSMEVELTRSLLVMEEVNDDDDDDTISHPSSTSSAMSPMALLSHGMSGLTRPLKSRILQVITSLAKRGEDYEADNTRTTSFIDNEEEAGSARNRISPLYSICGLLLFYHEAINKSLEKLKKKKRENATDSSSNLEPTIGSGEIDDDEEDEEFPTAVAVLDCLEEASVAYATSVRVYAAMLDSFTAGLATNENNEASLANALITLISEVRLSSPGFSSSSSSSNPSDGTLSSSSSTPSPDSSSSGSRITKVTSTLTLEFVCDTMIESVLTACTSLEDSSNLKKALVSAKRAGLANTRVVHWGKAIDEKERNLAKELVKKETENMLHNVGLGDYWTAFQRVEKQQQEQQQDVTTPLILSSQLGLSQRDLQSAIKVFYDSLYAPPFPSFGELGKTEKKLARSKTAANVIDVYRKIYDAVMNQEKGGYEDLSFLTHTPDQVRTLLSV